MKNKKLALSGSTIDGNTNPIVETPLLKKKKEKRCNAVKNWCFTYNNYCVENIQSLLALCKEFTEKYFFAEEEGENKTPHLQGFISLLKKGRPCEIFKAILNEEGKHPIHWESMKGSMPENIKYCSKEGGKFYKSSNVRLIPKLNIITNLHPWQIFVESLVKEPCTDDRVIHWFYDLVGNKGKTAMTKYLCYHYGAMLVEGKKKDILFGIQNAEDTDIFIFDFSRSIENYVSYDAIESVKNGIFFSTKYESKMILRNSPHIIIFANFLPEEEKLSKDRWRIYDLSKSENLI